MHFVDYLQGSAKQIKIENIELFRQICMMLCRDSQSALTLSRRHWRPYILMAQMFWCPDAESNMAVKTTTAVCEYHGAVRHNFIHPRVMLWTQTQRC